MGFRETLATMSTALSRELLVITGKGGAGKTTVSAATGLLAASRGLRTIAERARTRPSGSYTAKLLADPQRIGEKVMEEAEELARAAREESDERVQEEAADLIYHLLVLLASRGRVLAGVEQVLDERSR